MPIPTTPMCRAGHALAAWAKAGCEVRILLCTDGGKDRPIRLATHGSDPSSEAVETA